MNINLLLHTSLILTNYNISSTKVKKLIRLYNKNNLNLNLSEFKIKFNLRDIETFKEYYKITNSSILGIVENKLFYSRIYYENLNKYIKSHILSKLVKEQDRKVGIEVECFIYTKNYI